MEVRDMRGSEWLWTEKSILKSPFIDAFAYKVYAGLASYAGNVNQTAWPSHATLASELNMNRTTVIRAIKSLTECGAITYRKQEGSSNIYTLLPASHLHTPEAPKKEQSGHHRLILVFREAAMFFRGVDVRWSTADFARLKYVRSRGILNDDDIEKLMIAFLSFSQFSKFTPSMATMFSGGIFTALQNYIKQPSFYKDIDNNAVAFYRKFNNGSDVNKNVVTHHPMETSINKMLIDFKKKFSVATLK